MEKTKYNQNQYNKNWESKNKEHANYLKSRTAARSFIRNKATTEDLSELKQLIVEKEKQLEQENQ